ncbi:hypothetical protein ACMHYB_02050 [Sorangium sp. So ce1128]
MHVLVCLRFVGGKIARRPLAAKDGALQPYRLLRRLRRALAAAARRPSAVRTLTLIESAMQPLAIREPAVMWFLLRTITTLKLSFSAETRSDLHCARNYNASGMSR